MSEKQTKRGKRLRLEGRKRITAGLSHHRWPVLSLDGQWLAYAIGEGFDQCWAIADRKGRIGRLFEGPADSGASFGKDGSFAFGRKVGAASEIWFAPSLAAPAVRLLGGDGKIYQGPALSHDGRSLAFVCDEEGRGTLTLQILDLASGKRQRIASDRYGSAGRPVFSSTGELYFDGQFDGRLGIYRLAPSSDGAANEPVRISPTEDSHRRPSPVGRGLVLAEKVVEGKGAVRLVLLDERTGSESKLSDLDEAREPCSVLLDGKVRVAFIALGDDEPRRLDVYTARLRGLRDQSEADSLDAGSNS